MESNSLHQRTRGRRGEGINQQQANMKTFYSHLHITVIFVVIAVLTDYIPNAHAQNQINVDTVPHETVLIEGQHANLLCRYGQPINYCRIKIPGERILNLQPEWGDEEGFSYFGQGLQAGECGVVIKHVNAKNHGQVECNLGIRRGEAAGKINLIVALAPSRPEIEVLTPTQRPNLFEVDQQFKARCVVRDGRPAANITWLLDNEPIHEGLGRREEVSSLDSRNTTLITTVQEIQRVLTAKDNGKTLTCRATHIADNEKPNETNLQLFVRYRPQPLPDIKVYGLHLGSTAIINVTIEANPKPKVQWSIDGVSVPGGTQNGRYEAYEPIDIGNGLYNVTLSVAGLTLEDTNKDYYMRAFNDYGTQDYIVRISSSNTPVSTGLDVGAIVGIVVAVAILLIIVLLIVFARATGRWCFAAKSSKTTTSETSDTESTEVKVSKFRKLPKFEAIFTKKSEKTNKGQTTSSTKKDNNEQQNEDEQRLAGTTSTSEQNQNNEPKEDKQLVYAELVLKPSDTDKPIPPKSSTEYAEIVYVQKGQEDQTINLVKEQSK